MPSLEVPDIITTNVRWRWPSIHPEGRKFVLISAAIAIAFLFFIWDELGFVLVGVTIWVAAFFRDPIRTTPVGKDLIVAPADGLVTMITRVPPPSELGGADGLDAPLYTRVSIFMSVFDVHINRAPIAGEIKRVVYISGKFLNADLDKASEDNERQHFLVQSADGVRIGFTQIAGLVARRILAFAKPGDFVSAGHRIGLIRFGSRVDVFLPAGTAPTVALGQRSIAGETVLGRVGQDHAVTGVSQ
ncbi:MAG: Phosphatidylserine decarboxylase [uncultured Sphingomonadaceae bacterium]|uniref:Phosphatidylserine decarboxylase proenzyme n=1 Tax=uncultured Sphingomonadaceae bacterium TaxID=169976 RepID=A0A6J4RSB4_9SPHN|nr:MAG: Phosphatidylserine decarboxylase [uncultured Sphingomonadaceae bacterium]